MLALGQAGAIGEERRSMNGVHDPKGMTRFASDFLQLQGATIVGVATRETLAGGPPSTDLEYVLPGGKSAVCFAVPFDQEKIERYLAKRDHAGHQSDNFHTNIYATGLAVALAAYWNQHGIPSYGVCSNAVYRRDTPRGMADFLPDISHRYLAVRSGVGWLGLSGNLITRQHGAAVVLGSWSRPRSSIPSRFRPRRLRRVPASRRAAPA
jgi:epoxyqueuosine reductase QueG